MFRRVGEPRIGTLGDDRGVVTFPLEETAASSFDGAIGFQGGTHTRRKEGGCGHGTRAWPAQILRRCLDTINPDAVARGILCGLFGVGTKQQHLALKHKHLQDILRRRAAGDQV